MSRPFPPVLVVDDEKNMRLSLQSILEGDSRAVITMESAEKALELLRDTEVLLVITDARLGGMSGYEFLGQIKKSWPELPVLMITAYATPRLAADAIKAGAMDYISKPFAPEELLHAVDRCAERYTLLRENATLRARTEDQYKLEQIIGECAGLNDLRQLIRTVAPTNATVLILGESGTGKELIAGCLHSLSARRHKHYVRINCAAIPEALLESELFGHEKGAFTGAVKQKLGRVEEADGGTIFLDEIGDMSRPLQAKLLRFLEDGSFTRVGGTEELRVDVRLVAATNRDIVKAIQDGLFREDLFHRLNVVQFRPLPLRERGKDVLILAGHFLRHFSAVMNKRIKGISPAAQNILLAHRWPGNVRELRNAIERAAILEPGDELQPASLPDFRVESQLRKLSEPPALMIAGGLDESISAFERELISTTLERHGYSLGKAAEALKVSRHALRYRMQRLNIQGAPGDSAEDDSPDEKEAPGARNR